MPRAARRPVARLLATASLAGAVALSPSPAASQVGDAVTLRFDGAATTARYRGYAVGPVAGQVIQAAASGSPGQMRSVTLFCMDFLHAVAPGQTFTANVSAIAADPNALALARQPNGLEGYRKAVWLADQFALQAPAHWGGIQSAIWKIFGSGSFDGNPVKSSGMAVRNDPRNEAYWSDQATAFRTSSIYDGYDYSQYAIYTDVDDARPGSRQEFIGRQVVPEPGTLALAGAGALALAGWRTRARPRAVPGRRC